MLIDAVPVRLVTTPEDGVPRAGVTKVGELAKTRAPLPVSSVTAAAKFAEDGVARNVETFVPKPDTPVLIGRPVALVRVAALGVPRLGVVNAGDVDSAMPPVPVTAWLRAVATPVPNDVMPVPPFATGSVPVTPVDKGNPVALVRVAALGVPRSGVTRVGEVANTRAPDPVSSVTAAARFVELGVVKKVATPVPKPETPVEIGKSVALVNVAADGVPRLGVTSVGLVAKTKAPLPVSSVTAPARFAELGVAKKVATPVPNPTTPVAIGKPVALVRVAADGVPRSGLTRAGDVARTLLPDPVLLTETTFLLASSASAVDAVSAVRVGVPATLTAPENV
jgi:hypothetical protein